MEEKLERLIKVLKIENPILLLGAGFSYGAYNSYGEVPMGDGLKLKLLLEFYEGTPAYSELFYEDLREVCSNIVSDKKEKDLHKFLTSIFKDLNPCEWHLDFTDYPWKKIYTLNIDDLVENIYKKNNKKYTVQNVQQKENKNTGPLLIKLHGDVNHPDNPYVFDDETYMESNSTKNCSVDSFTYDFYNNDTIFIGTEFNEEDLISDLIKKQSSGYRDYKLHFFVVPKINNRKIRSIINERENYIHIPMETKEFIEIVKNIVNTQTDFEYLEKELIHSNFIKIGSNFCKKNYESKIYSGSTVSYYDIYYGYDIPFYDYKKIQDEVLKNKSNSIISVYGKAYIGKSTLAKRMLYELYTQEYYSFEIRISNILDFEVLNDYIQLLPCHTKLAILFEEAAMYYAKIRQLVETNYKNIDKMIIITVSQLSLHNSKIHEIKDYYNFYPLKLTYELNPIKAKLIYNKLEEKNRLGELTSIPVKFKKKRIDLICKQGNLIDSLYYITHGEGYESYFNKEFENIVNAQTEIHNLVYDIILFAVMGIESYPAQFVRKFYPNVSENQITKMDSLLDVLSNGDIKIRGLEFFKKFIVVMDNNNKIKILRNYLTKIDKNVDERILNNDTRIFECLLHFNSLKSDLRVDLIKNDLDELFTELEGKYKHISYYWLERALLKSAKGDYDNAYLFLSQAREIRPNSYKINHAYAQNFLDRGLAKLRIDPNDMQAQETYKYGENLILSILNDTKYSENKAHSVHTYIDRKIKYYELMNRVLQQEEYDDLCNKLLKVMSKDEDDKFLLDLKQEIIEYAYENDLKRRF